MKGGVRLGAQSVAWWAIVLACVGSSIAAQSGPVDSSERLQRIEESISRLEKKLAEVASLLAGVPSQPEADPALGLIDVSVSSSRGDSQAHVALIEFSDFECPFCGRHASGAYREIHTMFVDSGKVRYVFRHLPLDQIHSSARTAAEAAECAGAQGKFWEYHDRLFANQKALSVPDLNNHARSVGLSVDAFASCIGSGTMVAQVKSDEAEAKRVGLTGTPAFLIGQIRPDGSVQVTRKIVGAQPFGVFEAALKELLSQAETK